MKKKSKFYIVILSLILGLLIFTNCTFVGYAIGKGYGKIYADTVQSYSDLEKLVEGDELKIVLNGGGYYTGQYKSLTQILDSNDYAIRIEYGYNIMDFKGREIETILLRKNKDYRVTGAFIGLGVDIITIIFLVSSIEIDVLGP